jgi:hypothetical protein
VKNKTKSVSMAALTLATWLFASATPAAVAAPVANPNRPGPVEQTLKFDAGKLCAFPVTIDVVGKTKVIGKPLDDHTVTSPGLKITTTNTATGVSKKYTATGVSRYTVATDKHGVKYFEVVSTGQNILSSEKLGGFFFVRGNVNYAVTRALPDDQKEVRPFVPKVEDLDKVNAVNICDPLG